MNWLLWVLLGLGIIGVALLATGWWRYALTGYLIARVTPYEQPGAGAGEILILGDSTGYGTGARRSSESIAGRLGTDYPTYAISNNSSNGRKIAAAREVVADLSDTVIYDLVVLQIGANDLIAGGDPGVVVGELQQLIELVQPHTNNIIVITAGNIGATPMFTGEQAAQLENASRQFDQQMSTVVQTYNNTAFVSLFDEPANDVFIQSPGVYTAIDGLHPTSAGYEVWYQKAKPYFEAVLD